MYLATDIQTSEKICMELKFKGQEKKSYSFCKAISIFFVFLLFFLNVQQILTSHSVFLLYPVLRDVTEF